MVEYLDKLKLGVGILGRGAAIQFSPGIFAGMLVTILKHEHIGVKEVSKFVLADVELWAQLPKERQDQVRHLAGHLGGSPIWLTPEWLVNAIRKELPGLASLFLGDPAAAAWLIKQVASIKANVWPEEVKA